ncbi:MAG: outer membrane protein transport protein [Syntrophaceae bacterium]|nr:outer membrane protein transport protein [Syntrophaceae bacterium]
MGGLASSPALGLSTQFDPNWPGRYNSYSCYNPSLDSTPTPSRSTRNFPWPAALTLMNFDPELEKINAGYFGGAATTYPNLPDANSKLEGDAWGWGFNLALHYKPTEDWMLGVSYRSRVSQKIAEGDADFTNPHWAAFSATTLCCAHEGRGASIFPRIFAGHRLEGHSHRDARRRGLLDALEQLRQAPDHVQASSCTGGGGGHSNEDKELGRRLPLHDRRRVEVHAQLEGERKLCL